MLGTPLLRGRRRGRHDDEAVDEEAALPPLRLIRGHRTLEPAALPNVHLKVSFFGSTTPTRDEKELALVVQKAQECIRIFTPHRCMFASNLPVDNHADFGSWTMKDLEKTFLDIAAPFTPEECAYLWRDTALTVYRMN